MIFPPLACLPLLLVAISPVAANVEKTIFLGPEPVNIPPQSPSLSNLNIDTLTPANWSLRTHVDAIFPTAELESGVATWLILDDLTEGQRYEVRICWLATQPTAFHLETFTLPTVFDTPELITSLHNYSMSRHLRSPPPPAAKKGERESSVLFLRIHAAADYFTTDRALMERPEPVLVDIILDPFVCFNVLPRSLVPTVWYVALVAVGAWVLGSRLIVPWLSGLMVEGGEGVVEGDEKKMQ